MTGKDLKNSILQLAIQGKLVPQNPNDEPASELLARIRQEKERLVKEKKLKKKDLETTPITDEEKPFGIPESWEWCRWGEISFSIQYGVNAPALESGAIRMVRISDIQDNEVLWDTVPFCNVEEDEIATRLLGENDILFARTGGTVGKSFLVKEVPYPAVFAGYLIRTRYSENLIPLYLKFFMESALYWEQLRDGTIATAQPNCNGKKLAEMILPIPPLAEQQRIVAKIEELMPLVEEYDKNEQKLAALNKALPEQLRQSVLQQAIMGRLVPQDDNEEPASELLARIRQEKERLVKEKKLKKKDLETTPITDEEKTFEIPESWEWCRLGDIMNIVMGQSPESDVINYQSGIEFHQGKIAFTDYLIANSGIYTTKPTKIAESDSLLICVRAPIGNVNYTDRRICIGRGLCSIRPLYNAEIKYWFYSMECLKPILEKKGTGSTFKAISLDVLKMQSIPLPPLAEQQRIVAKIEELFSVIDNLKTY